MLVNKRKNYYKNKRMVYKSTYIHIALKIKPTFQPEIDYNSERMVALKPEKREKEITVRIYIYIYM